VLDRLNELERPIAASIMIERLEAASPDEREQTLEWLRQVGAGRVGAGVVYEALLGFGPAAAQVLSESLYSPNEHVRVRSVFGVGAALEPAVARSRLVRTLGDESAIPTATPPSAPARHSCGSVG
jgi:hypothetical protein